MSVWLVWNGCRHWHRRLATPADIASVLNMDVGSKDVTAPNPARKGPSPRVTGGTPLTKSHEEALVAVATVGV